LPIVLLGGMLLLSSCGSTIEYRFVPFPAPVKPTECAVDYLERPEIPMCVLENYLKFTEQSLILERTTEKESVTKTDNSFIKNALGAASWVGSFVMGLLPF